MLLLFWIWYWLSLWWWLCSIVSLCLRRNVLSSSSSSIRIGLFPRRLNPSWICIWVSRSCNRDRTASLSSSSSCSCILFVLVCLSRIPFIQLWQRSCCWGCDKRSTRWWSICRCSSRLFRVITHCWLTIQWLLQLLLLLLLLSYDLLLFLLALLSIRYNNTIGSIL